MVIPPSYSTTPIPVNEVESFLTDATCGAGATLQVTTAGIITPNDCATLNNHVAKNQEIKFHTSLTEKTINIHFSNEIANNVTVEIYSLNGQKISTYTNNKINSNETLKLSIENISNGTYLCKIRYGDKIKSWKFIKN